MANSTVWWLLAGGAVVFELLSGSVYLLLVGAGFASAAIAAHLGFGPTGQYLTAAIVGVAAVTLWRWVRRNKASPLPSGADPDVNLDIGQKVFVDAWDADGTASVRYRGAQWTVVTRAGNAPSPGEHRVAEVVGSRLIVDKI